MRVRLAVAAALALAGTTASATALAADRVGCNPLAVIVAELDGFSVVDDLDLGLPAPTASDPYVTRAFENDGREILLFVSVSEYDTAVEAAASLGRFSEGFLESATSSTGPISSQPGSVRYSGVSPDARIEALEATIGRYVVSSIAVTDAEPAEGTETESVVARAVASQSARLSDRCLSDVVHEPTDQSLLEAGSLGQLTGLIVIGGGTVWGAWVVTKRARRSETAKWAP